MFSWRKRGGKLQKKDAKLSCIVKNRHRPQKKLEHCFLQVRHLFRIPALDKAGIRPACRADENFSSFCLGGRSFDHPSTKSHAQRRQIRSLFYLSLPPNECFFDLHNVDIEIILKMRGGAAW